MDVDRTIEKLEEAWDTKGFLYSLRQGVYNFTAGEEFLSMLRSISISESELVPKRLLSLLWSLPLFLTWQKERVAEISGDTITYDQFIKQVENILIDVLGLP